MNTVNIMIEQPPTCKVPSSQKVLDFIVYVSQLNPIINQKLEPWLIRLQSPRVQSVMPQAQVRNCVMLLTRTSWLVFCSPYPIKVEKQTCPDSTCIECRCLNQCNLQAILLRHFCSKLLRTCGWPLHYLQWAVMLSIIYSWYTSDIKGQMSPQFQKWKISSFW